MLSEGRPGVDNLFSLRDGMAALSISAVAFLFTAVVFGRKLHFYAMATVRSP